MHARALDMGALFDVDGALIYNFGVGDTEDGQAQNGGVVDRLPAGGGDFGRADSLSLLHHVSATLAENETATINVDLQHGDEAGGGDMADVDSALQPANVVLTGTGTGGSTETSTVKVDIEALANKVTGLKQYVRVEITVTVGNSPSGSSATVRAFAAILLGGKDRE